MRESAERDLVKCEDMRIHAANAIRFMEDMDFSEFSRNEVVQAAVVRSIEVVGEAARLVSEETRGLHPEIPWVLIIGMRNILVHEYGTIDIGKVFEVVRVNLPQLIDDLVKLIAELESRVGWNPSAK